MDHTLRKFAKLEEGLLELFQIHAVETLLQSMRRRSARISQDPSGAIDVCTSPDEYPYAASADYGNGPGNGPTFIRCTGARENSVEGSNWSAALSRRIARGGCGNNRGVPAGCLVTIGFDNIDIRSDACINKAGARNDGFYYNYNGAAYTLVPRDGNASEPVFDGIQLSDPDPSLFIPPDQRRELLLDNGHRVMVPPSNKSWEGEMWLLDSDEGDAVVEAKVVKELLGMEKSLHLR
ncbi:hypothetical protein LTS18_007220 [Coniosporium uncinatum]|uniref:Uncharacterized protein n=1 Tax=Coniosporium uncinatum TaxID=93489 RepID=A0ACC3DZB2_9PEZI|nr:hypothetical protein LTS18_007220 [Coniosporium uncinatum]